MRSTVRERFNRWRKNHPEAYRAKQRRYRQRNRDRVLEHYGARCACCGETANAFLTVDHVDGGGREHRAIVRNTNGLYIAIRRAGFPADYRVLCWNCNCARSTHGECPHEAARTPDQKLLGPTPRRARRRALTNDRQPRLFAEALV